MFADEDQVRQAFNRHALGTTLLLALGLIFAGFFAYDIYGLYQDIANLKKEIAAMKTEK